jgi:hypothetical protein
MSAQPPQQGRRAATDVSESAIATKKSFATFLQKSRLFFPVCITQPL